MKTELIYGVLILSICFFNEANAQNNLVPNPSFEDTLKCPISGNQLSYAIPWYSPSNGSPDYFNSCYTLFPNNVGVPSNLAGYEYARTGNAYAGIDIYFGNGREYIEVQLDSTLKVGKKYCVIFYVSLANNSNDAIDTLGAYLSDTSIFVNATGPLPFNPQIKNKNGIVTDTLNWVEVAGEYIAVGGEQYITIGVFNTDATINHINTSNPNFEAYYYVDDVTVIACNGLGVEELNDIYKIKMYPNPANENVTFTVYLPEKQSGLIEIYNMLGSEIASYVLKQGDNKLNIPTASFIEGIYLYKIIVDGKLKQSNKFVIIK